MYCKCFQLSRQFVKLLVPSQSFLSKGLNHEKYIAKRWAGHAKWQNIKSTKDSNDHARAEAFQKLTRMINLAVKESGPDINTNSKLKRIFEESRKINMPKATFDRAVQNGLTQRLEKPYWVVFIGRNGLVLGMEVTFTKRNPAYLQNILGSFTKRLGLRLETHFGDACTERGVIIADPLPSVDNPYDKAVEDAIEIGVDEVFENDDKTLLFECLSDRVDGISKKLSDLGYNVQSANVELDFQNFIKLSDDEQKEVEHMISKLQACYQEVVRVSYNAAS